MQILSKQQNQTMITNLKAYIAFYVECFGKEEISKILGISNWSWKSWKKNAGAGFKAYKMSTLTRVCETTSIPLEKLLARTVVFEAALKAHKESLQRSAVTLVKTPHGVVVSKHKIENYQRI